MNIRVASYNLRKCIGTDRRRDPGRIVDVINSVSADVVALQEADRRLGDRPAALPRDLIERATDFTALPLATNEESLGWHGQTILLRRGLRPLAVDRIALPGFEPRGAVLAEFGLDDGSVVRVVGVHLGLMRHNRVRQLQAIRAALAVRPAMATAIVGDFNEWSAGAGMTPLAGGFTVHAPGLSFHAARPMAALDRIALAPDLRIADAGVIETPLSRRASDHLPIWADLRLAPATADGLPQ